MTQIRALSKAQNLPVDTTTHRRLLSSCKHSILEKLPRTEFLQDLNMFFLQKLSGNTLVGQERPPLLTSVQL